MLHREKILIVGSQGQLGNALRRTMPEGLDVLAVDRETVDVTRERSVFELVEKFRPGQIINVTGYTDVDGAEREPEAAYAVNQQGVAHLASAAKAVGARLLHVSTDYVFSGHGDRPYRPDDRPEPLGVYGKSKLAGEQELAKIVPDEHLLVRTAWLYSPWGENFVTTMLRLMQEREELRVIADRTGSPTSARRLAEVLWRLVSMPQARGTYHWTDAGTASWYDFACMIQRYGVELGLPARSCTIVPIPANEFPQLAARPRYSVLDSTSLARLLALEPLDWRVSLKSVVQEVKVVL